ncbi:hypothetical protein [Fodinicurvata sp. EGI_FJ10296]|uniref:hypothetical protein n=1 Tax=Fodinicurvata sp. EGI_FJ10296 TaxID=3231908 RepID=UPI003453C576
MFSRDDFARLAEILATINGRFLRSLHDRPALREIFADFDQETVAPATASRRPAGQHRAGARTDHQQCLTVPHLNFDEPEALLDDLSRMDQAAEDPAGFHGDTASDPDRCSAARPDVSGDGITDEHHRRLPVTGAEAQAKTRSPGVR